MDAVKLFSNGLLDVSIGTVTNKFIEICNKQKRRRIERFLSCLQTEADRMSADECEALNEYVASEEGQDVLLDFVDTVLSTKDKRVHIALALLYCNDRDYYLTDQEKHVFCMSTRHVHPDLITFYLSVTQVKSVRFMETMPEVYSLDSFQLDKVPNYSQDQILEMVGELKTLRLLLVDPKTYSTADEDMTWSVKWGMNDSKMTMARLLTKAESILVNTDG
jgi:hypothetical protein